ncbi:MAG: iron-containing alcohol dehydrogenase [Christensenellales bacterium]
MNIFKKIYCRTFQGIMKIVLPLMPYREPKALEKVEDIAPILIEKAIKNVLLVTDKSIKELGLTKTLEKSLEDNKIKFKIFDKVVPNPTSANVENGLKIYNESGCGAIIALGGGSVMDCAKAIGARAVNPKKPLNKMKGLLKVKYPLPPLFAIPTTAGTGSETTVTAVITDSVTHHKYTINDFDLIPHYAVLDASLTLGLPKGLTATTGVDALTHSIEAFIGGATTENTRKNALESARLIFENLPKVVKDGSNIKARKEMLRASYMAGLAFTRSYVGYVHAIAHTLGGEYGVPHGLANAVILPYMLTEYGSSVYKKLKVMAVYCKIAESGDSEQIATKKFIDRIIEMNEDFDIPKAFDCIKEKDIPELAKKASAEANPLYPVPKLMSAKELEKMYYKVRV